MDRLDLRRLRHPIVGAPMAGGASTAELVAAMAEAGGMGFLAGAYRSAGELAGDIAETRRHTAAAFGVNVFVPSAEPVDEAAVLAYRGRTRPRARRGRSAAGRPENTDG